MTLSKADIDLLFGPEPADSVESLLDAPITGEDISLAMQDPAFTPTQADYLKFEDYSKTKQTDWINTISQSVDAAANMIGGAISEGAQGAVINPLNYIEGAAQGTRQLYGLVAQSQDPASPLFKFKDLVAGSGTVQSRYEQFLDARDFANRSARLERGEDFLAIQPEFTNPEFVQGVSMILDPTLALPGIGEILGAGKLATRAVGKGAQLTGRAVAGVARPLERFAGAAERIAAETIGTTPEALRNVASTAGIAGALGIAPEAAAFAAIPAGIRTAREAGEALSRAGENLMTQPSRVGPLEAIGAAPGANLRQRMLGVIGQYGGDAAVDASLRGLAGGIEGAALGTGLGYLSGGEEGAAAGLGSGGVQGVAGALGGRAYQKLTGAAAKEARAGDLGRFIDGQQDPTTKALFERVRDAHGVDTASALMDVGDLVKGKLGDIDIRYLSDVDFADQFGGRARGVQVEIGDRPTIVINADILGKGKGDSPLYTLGHELFHALEKSEQLAGGATEIKNALVGRWIQEGDVIRKLADGVFSDAEIDARFNEYRDKLSAGSPQRADELAKFDTINKKADYIASELAAEHFAALIAGQKPDAMLKGFSGLTRQLLDAALTQNSSKAIARAAASIEGTFGVKPTDSVLFPDLKQASLQLNAMLRDLVRARRKLDEKIILDTERGGRVLKPEDISNPLAAKELINLGLAEQMPDGSIRNLSSEEIRVREDRDVTSLRSIVEKVPGARIVDGEVLGRYSPEQLSAIEQSQTISSRMKDMIRGANLAIENGNSLFVTYYAALRRVKNKVTGKESPKYDSGIRVSEREFSPYSFRLTKADNPLVNAIDITLVRNQLTKLLKKNGSVGGLWGNVDGFMSDLAKYFTNLDQKEGARRSAEIFGVDKAKFLGDFVTSNEKSGSKFVRSFRLDRVGSMSPGEFRAKFSEEAYQLSKTRWMPAEKLGDKSITNSEEGYRIISGAKHKLYGTDGKLIGIYDTQTQAERKADATQTRLQPEVRQQQRQAGDEGRQATEAGGRNRAVGGQEGQGQGGAVRQEGDVRFMPEGKSAGLAVLDNELELNLPKRPKVLDIANAFQDRFGKAIEYRKSNPQDNAKLSNALVQEIQRAVELHPEAKGWYDENIKLTMDVIRDLDPDLAKPENDFMFKVILAATSDGNKVGPQFQQTWKEYSNWKNTGKISGDFVSGDRIENIKGNLKMFNEMTNSIGWEKTKDFFTRKGTVKEVRQALMDTFGWTKKEAQGVGSSELTDEVVPFAVVLGPKLGSFFNNLYGDFSSVTMDRWFMRTIGRLTGTQVEPLSGAKVREMRNNLRDAVSRLTPSEFELLGIKRGDLKGTSIDGSATTISGRFAKKSLRDTAKQSSEAGQSALEETRKFANALKKGLNPLVEAPVDGTHRRWIRERIAEVQNDLRSKGVELENADLQAVLWYLEKELYEKLNYRSKSGESDYASAASSLYQSVVGRPSDVYARGTGRVRAIGGDGGGNVLDAANGGQAPGQEVAGQRYMPSDTDYLSAVKQGDTKAAQQMVDEAAKAAGYPPKVFYHGTQRDFTVFDKSANTRNDFGRYGKGFYFTKDKYTAAIYAGRNPFSGSRDVDIPKGATIHSVYLDIKNPKTIEAKDIKMPSTMAEAEATTQKLIEEGYDGVVGVVAGNAESPNTEYVVFSPSQIKSADPITRDDAGNVIPLSQRFKASDDIRYMPAGIQREMGRNVDFANPPTAEKAVDALSSEKKSFWRKHDELPEGSSVGVRIDIPAFLNRGTYVQTIHESATPGDVGGRIGYDTSVRLSGPVKFFVKQGSSESSRGAVAIKEGRAKKHPIATVEGNLIKDRSVPPDIEDWTPVGMDPKKHSYFYDKRTGQPVKGGSESYSVGNTVFVKDPVPGDLKEFRYMPAGDMATGRSVKDHREAMDLFEKGYRLYGALYDGMEDPIRLKKASEIEKYDPENLWAVPSKKIAAAISIRNMPAGLMPSPDSAMPGAYSFPGGYRALPGKAKGSLRLYGPAGSLIGIASSLDEAQRILRRKGNR